MRDIAMSAKIDLVGQRFGRLTVIKEAEERVDTKVVWVCLCKCGTKDVRVGGCDLRKGHTQSCGCLKKERTIKAKKTHGMSRSKEYRAWKQMWGRCTDPKNKRYANYGGRGINVCDRWKSFENFFADMGERPAGFSIERVDNEQGYNPGNCVYADVFTQNNNRRARVDNTSGYPGVFWYPYDGINKWRVIIIRRNKTYNLGYFESLEDAIAARKEAEQRFDSRPLGENSTTGQSA